MISLRSAGVGVFAVALAAAGCESPAKRNREEAAQRWNVARAQLKAKLAADELTRGNVNDAAGQLDEAARLTPDDPRLVVLRARVWLAEGETTRAAELLESARLDGPAQAEAEYLLGTARQQQQRWEQAIQHFRRAVELNRYDVSYVVATVQVLLQVDRPLEAFDLLLAKADDFSWTSTYQAALAECYEQLGDWASAAAAWQRVNAADETDAATPRRLAVALFHAEKYTDAIPLFAALVPGDSEDVLPLRLMLAECYLATGRVRDARQHVEFVAQRVQDDAHTERLLARILAADGEHEPALRAARRAIALDPRHVPTLELAAALADRLGNRALVAEMAARLVALEPANSVAARLLSSSR